MRLVSVQELRSLEAAILAQGAVSEAGLIERAGAVVARYAQERFGPLAGRRVVVLCGKGHNAADGMVAARHLADAGAKVLCCLSFERAELALLALDALRKAEEAGVRSVETPDPAALLADVSPDLILDALVGVGARLPLGGALAQAVLACKQAACPVLALDIPSGIDADSGALSEPHIRAQATVTFIAAKPGLVLPPGAGAAGDIKVEALGVDPGLVREHSRAEAFDLTLARQQLPKQAWNNHKKKAQVLVLAGSMRYPGAALLCARAAYRAGAGLVRLAVPQALLGQTVASLPEAVPLGLAGAFATQKDLGAILEFAQGMQAVVLGPGLGEDPATLALTRQLWAQLRVPAVFDADALQQGLWSETAGALRVLTPHEGELKRLLGPEGPQALLAGRPSAVRGLAQLSGAVCVLKGPATLIADPAGRLAVNTVGGPVLATAGSGDVLAGALAALLAQGAGPFDAACLAAWAHGLAGQFWAQANGGRGLLASDLADLLPKALAHAGA